MKSEQQTVLRAVALCFAAAFAAAVLLSGPAYGADFRLEPSIGLSEEYNSNVFLESTNEQEDYITTISPAINALYRAPLWDWDLRYTFQERRYAKLSFLDRPYQLSVLNTTRIIDERVGILVSDEYARVSLSPTRDYTLESTFVGQTDQNIFMINPFLAVRPQEQTTVTAGYSYRNTWYQEPSAIDTLEYTRSLVVRYDLSPNMMFSVNYQHIRNVNRIEDFQRNEVQGRMRYEYAPRSSLSAGYGHVSFDIDYPGAQWQKIGDAMLVHNFGTATGSLEAARQFIPDPLNILRREDRIVASVNSEQDRITARFTTGGYNYYGVISGNRVNSRTMGSLQIGYSITPETRLIVNGTRELAKSYSIPPANVLVMIKGVRLQTQSSIHVTMGMECRFITSEAHDSISTSYRSEIIAADIRYQF